MSATVLHHPQVTVDEEARRRAVDGTTESFIVQAPAGSGKTELLVRRMLRLLALSSRPEEVVAVTFTTKAAAEMADRVLSALRLAEAHPIAPPDGCSDHETQGWAIAQAALSRDRAQGWDILRQPSRLQVVTFDSLARRIASRMPRLSGLSPSDQPTEEPETLYREAARNTIDLLEGDHPAVRSLERLLLHLDNDQPRVEDLLISMLSRRDQWLRHVIGVGGDPAQSRRSLECALAALVGDHVGRCAALAPPHLGPRLAALLAYANLHWPDPDECPLGPCLEHDGWPGDDPLLNLQAWLALNPFLLTQMGAWRAQVDKRCGFPPVTAFKGDPTGTRRAADIKVLAVELLKELAEPTNEPFREALGTLSLAPAAAYPEAQWEILQALVELLPLAAAALTLVFRRHDRTDFSAVAMAAVRALEDDDGGPSDLAFALDSTLRHLLVDEFQDTSLTQYGLIERLTVGWEPGDGRTLFLVGDPMQAIYGWREADVGLFLRTARERRLGSTEVEPLLLRRNFRSRPEVVEWVNQTFVQVLPRQEDPVGGGVVFSESVATRSAPETHAAGVYVHAFDTGQDDAIPPHIVRLVRQGLALTPRAGHGAPTVAILVRARTGLAPITRALREARLPYRAVEIDPLGGRPAVMDLMALTRAMLHPADRIAWLAVLRAPWCGLTLMDLHAVAGLWDDRKGQPAAGSPTGSEGAERQADILDFADEDEAPQAAGAVPEKEARNARKSRPTVPELLRDPRVLARLSPEGRERSERLAAIMLAALRERGRRPLRRWVEGVWMELGGPATALDPQELAAALDYLRLLERAEDELEGGSTPDPMALMARIGRLNSQPDPTADSSLQVMTMHKAKGLEFDTVILPNLNRGKGRDSVDLMAWAEVPSLPAPDNLVLAPINATGDDKCAIYGYVQALRRRRTDHELRRLLYVAATRAREALHLVGQVGLKEGKAGERLVRPPQKGCPLNILWPAVASAFETELDAVQAAGESSESAEDEETALAKPSKQATGEIEFRRLPLGWMLPQPSPSIDRAILGYGPADDKRDDADFGPDALAGLVSKSVGSVVHRLLQRVAQDGVGEWDRVRVASCRPMVAAALRRDGVPAERIEGACDMVEAALHTTLGHHVGRWILESGHAESGCELELTGRREGRLINAIIDRTFVDDDGTRWIIDYKVSRHEGADMDAFLDAQFEHYSPQLERYAHLLRGFSPADRTRKIRLALYFPLIARMRDWDFTD